MTQSNILLLEAIESTLRAANLTSNAMILKAIIEEEKNIQLDAPVIYTSNFSKGGKMTPLHLDILMHYYTRSGDYDMIPENKTRTDYAFELAALGLLYSGKPEGKPTPLFAITNFGKEVFNKTIKHFAELSNCDV